MTILLFDVDGTLTPSGDIIQPKMTEMIQKATSNLSIKLGIVGGGTFDKIKWQMQDSIKYFKYVFAECGAVIYVDGQLVTEKNMLDYCNRDILNSIIRCALSEISKMPIIFHGHQIDFRKGLVYISPPGMQATQVERSVFIGFDNYLDLRKNLLDKLQEINVANQFEIALGGAVGIAVYPHGWNKSQVMEYFVNSTEDIYYFGDKTEPDGNDYPLYSHQMVKGVAVGDYHDTINKLNEIVQQLDR